MSRIQAHGVAQPERLLFIDGLRGVAAMMVVFYHFRMVMSGAVKNWFPSWLDSLFSHGNLGVDVFFVLSGFVIAHSIRDGDHTLRYLGKFIVRRSIRLDPPLWTTILLEISLLYIGLYFYPDLGSKLPNFWGVLVNIAYLQEMLRVPNVVDAFWSLTYEVQFYLVTVCSMVALRMIGKWDVYVTSWSKGFMYTVGAIAFAYSIAIYHKAVPVPLRGIFLERWFQFFLGIMAWAVVQHKLRMWIFALAWTACLASALVVAPSGYRLESSLCGLIVSALILWVGSTGRMASLLNDKLSQFLGRISYSLYLLHLPIGWRFAALMKRLAGPEFSVITGTTVFAGSIALSIFSSWLMFRVLEAPSMRLARKVKLPRVGTGIPSISRSPDRGSPAYAPDLPPVIGPPVSSVGNLP